MPLVFVPALSSFFLHGEASILMEVADGAARDTLGLVVPPGVRRRVRGRLLSLERVITRLARVAGGELDTLPGSIAAYALARPYSVEIRLLPLSDATWDAALALLATEARFAASLLAGEMPRDIDEVFLRAGASLFPGEAPDLATSCSCPDWANRCKHVAATHYVLADALDRDPFLLFELRGRSKSVVLTALRARRDRAPVSTPARTPTPERTSGVSLGEVTVAEYDRPRAAWPALALTFEPPRHAGGLLAQLGAPASWRDDQEPADHLAPFVAAAAERARRMALGERGSQ